jgi:hypothetical protein
MPFRSTLLHNLRDEEKIDITTPMCRDIEYIDTRKETVLGKGGPFLQKLSSSALAFKEHLCDEKKELKK